ncbi:TetR/AcrR family transcriptional regulator [Nocardia carnea]|uniref:TetR/AcrR family transcriptional regulator n=1 Tax=Nocardia carnea TaxID=37328 RepID=UPI002458B0C1|nr:TetR/AcrR family transcriptional regulator [Nocardia carnea]
MPDLSAERPYHHGNLRTALLDAAGRSLRERGVDQLSLRDLAREIGVSHAAPRRHFADRQALLDALAEDGFARLDMALRAELAVGGDFPSRLRAAMGAYTRFATENPALLELMYTGKHRPGAERIARAAEAPFALMHDLVVEGQGRGALPAGDTRQLGLVLFATMQGLASLVNGNFVEPEMLGGLLETTVEQFLRRGRPPVA